MTKKTTSTKVIAIIGIALLVTGGVLLYKYFRPKKKDTGDKAPPVDESIVTKAVNKVTGIIKPDFPLQKGSNNKYVKQLQQALINRYGMTILPKYGADGDWGSETDTAVKSKLSITTIADQKTLNDIINKLNP